MPQTVSARGCCPSRTCAGRRAFLPAEDTLHAGGGEEGRQILLGYLGELGPRRLLQLPVGEEVEVRVGLKRCRQVYSSSLSRSGVAAGAGAAAAFLPSSPASITVLQPRDEGRGVCGIDGGPGLIGCFFPSMLKCGDCCDGSGRGGQLRRQFSVRGGAIAAVTAC